MPYDIILAPEAVEDLHLLKANIRAIVRAVLVSYLRHEPTQVSKSRIKRLRGLRHPQYRLRIDEIRVFYDVHEQDVEILAIINKSAAEAWLARFGEPEEGATDEADPAFGSKE
jgi:mRNA interferase RelE/StbE